MKRKLNTLPNNSSAERERLFPVGGQDGRVIHPYSGHIKRVTQSQSGLHAFFVNYINSKDYEETDIIIVRGVAGSDIGDGAKVLLWRMGRKIERTTNSQDL